MDCSNCLWSEVYGRTPPRTSRAFVLFVHEGKVCIWKPRLTRRALAVTQHCRPCWPLATLADVPTYSNFEIQALNASA